MPFNPKRRIAVAPDPDALEDLAARVRYGGNPEHKRNPGDFGLTPPARPRADKSKCDWVGIVEQAVALRLLCEGIRRGLVSEQRRGGYPQRAFAREFLCPFDALRDDLGNQTPDDEFMEDAALRFDVSPVLVRNALVDHDAAGRGHLVSSEIRES